MFRAKAMNVFVEFMASAVAAWKGSSSSTVVNGVVKIYVVHSLATSQLHLLKADMLCETGLGVTMKTTSKQILWSVLFFPL